MKAKTKPEPVVEPEPVELAISGNTGELRSEKQAKPTLFASLFGGATSSDLLPETRALDSVLEQKQAKKKFKVKPAFEPQEVEFSGYSTGTIVIDTELEVPLPRRELLDRPPLCDRGRPRRPAVHRQGNGRRQAGMAALDSDQEMQKREPKKYGQYKDGMDGGPDNPLGARAIYLFQGKSDTHIRIHGTNQPQSIGSAASNGCFRMINDHVIDLYNRVRVGTPVVVL